MAELADALDLGSSGVTRAGSIPVSRSQAKTLCFQQLTINVKHFECLAFFVWRPFIPQNLHVYTNKYEPEWLAGINSDHVFIER